MERKFDGIFAHLDQINFANTFRCRFTSKGGSGSRVDQNALLFRMAQGPFSSFLMFWIYIRSKSCVTWGEVHHSLQQIKFQKDLVRFSPFPTNPASQFWSKFLFHHQQNSLRNQISVSRYYVRTYDCTCLYFLSNFGNGNRHSSRNRKLATGWFLFGSGFG